MTREEARNIFANADLSKVPDDVIEAFFCLGISNGKENCNDYISRQAVKEQMIKYGFHAPDMTVTEFVEGLPSVTPQPKSGWWIDTGSGQECSECHEIQYGYDNFRRFCAYCGTRMIESEE